MRTAYAAILLALSSVGSAAENVPAPLKVLFHLPFDGSAVPSMPTDGVRVSGAEALKFVEGKVGRAGDFRGKAFAEYRGLPMPGPKAGTIELWLKSAHDAREMNDHYFLTFLTADGKPAIEIHFYHVEMSAQVKMAGPKRVNRRYGWGWAKDRWQHIAVTWGGENGELMLYRNGVESGHPRPHIPFPRPAALRVGCDASGHAFASAVIDEVAAYDRCLTRSQIKWLYENGALRFPEKLAKLRGRVARDEAIQKRRHHLLFEVKKFAILHGRHTSLLHWPDKRFAALGLPVPTPVHETKLATTDLSRFDAVLVPGGGGLRLDKANQAALLKFVREGGGYVGICGGANTAGRYGLIDAKRYAFDVRGAVYNTLKKHPVTEGYDVRRKLLIPHASGPLFVLKEGSGEVPVILFRVGGADLPTFVNVIAKTYGKGRVVAFSSHPEASPRTYRLLRNALMWASGILDADAAGK